ncbi:MAG: glycosyltransferase, partial [Candidatus Kapabacteria bacterium]|nr:glycosyltransferase [Candidatus Kapabacteria bacterium]
LSKEGLGDESVAFIGDDFPDYPLLKRCGLPVRLDIPLIGMIGRLNEQKGVELVLEAAERLFAEDIHFVLLGDGEQEMKQKFAELAERYPHKASVTLGFDDDLAHLIEAGADMYLMPSLFEPCGLNQQYSLVYGTVPIVRSTGGLKDTVFEYNEETGEGNGFVFNEFSADAMLDAIHRALQLYRQRDIWLQMVKQGMKEDHSWGNAARQYSEMYRSIMKDLE